MGEVKQSDEAGHGIWQDFGMSVVRTRHLVVQCGGHVRRANFLLRDN